MKHICWGTLTALILSMAVQFSVAGQEATPVPIDAEAYSAYRLEVVLDPEAGTIGGTIGIDWLNATDAEQDVLYLRLFPNASYYGDGELTIETASINGERVTPEIGEDETLASLPMDEAVAIGERAEVELTFMTVIPTPNEASFGIFGGSERRGWTLADWYPIVAGWDDGEGWYLDAPTQFGDPTFADAALYEVMLTAPSKLAIVAGGEETDRSKDLRDVTQTVTYETTPARDFTITMLPQDEADDLTVYEREVHGTTIRVTLPVALDVDGVGEIILDDIEQGFPVYEELLGEYAEDDLEVTTAPISSASGISWHGLIWLGLENYTGDGVLDDGDRDYLRFLLTHELGHQWLAGIIGSNNNDHGFMTEGLTNHAAVLVLRETQGVEYAEHILRDYAAGSYTGLVRDGRDGVADAPLTDETNVVIRSFLVYGKGAVGFEAIRQEIGDEAYHTGLKLYAEQYRFEVSDPGDLQACWEEASGAELDTVWSFWFDEANVKLADLEAVFAGFAAT